MVKEVAAFSFSKLWFWKVMRAALNEFIRISFIEAKTDILWEAEV